jgi:N-acetylneuraminate synthase
MTKNITYSFDDPTHTFVIAEAGSNWKVGSYEEDLQQAKKLIEIASRAGADAVKFQTYRPETVYVPNAGQINYLSKSHASNSINEMFERLSMPYEMLRQLAKYCENNGIIFMSTPFSVQDAKEIDPYVMIHKIASYEINHIRLLEFLAHTKKPILISTGASTFDEIDFAVDVMKKNNSGKIGLMQNTSKYPAPINALNISVIPKLKERYNVAVGLSDHSMDPLIGPLLAIGMGATIIEKHFTLDRNLEGPDHSFALIPEELKKMIVAIRDADKAKGSGDKEILIEEKELQRFATRSIQAIKNISKGDILAEGINIDLLRPGNQKRGADARFLFQAIGKKAMRDISIGEGVLLTDYE